VRIGRKPEVATCPRPAGYEDVEVDAGVDDVDPSGIGAVLLDQLGGLCRGVGDEPVGGVDDLLLADQAAERLGGVAGGQGGVLDLAHGVHGVHQRHSPPVTRDRTDLAGQPVVRVHEVVAAGCVDGFRTQHLADERAHLSRKVRLGQPLVRPRGDVAHEYAGVGLHHRWLVRRRGPGEHLDLDVLGGETAGELEDVDVHSTRVAGAGLVERRRVDAEHGEPAYSCSHRRS
jgi:hypothetical protein